MNAHLEKMKGQTGLPERFKRQSILAFVRFDDNDNGELEKDELQESLKS